jgi:capsular polysaccharide biosynthesis protein
VRNALELIQRRFTWVVLALLIGASLGIIYSYAKGGDYTATARLFIRTSARDAVEASQGNEAAENRVRTYSQMAIGPELLSRAAAKSGTGLTLADVEAGVGVAPVPGTVLLEISYSNDSPETAVRVADAVAAGLSEQVTKLERPIGGGEPNMSLVLFQGARAGVTKNPVINYLFLAGGALIGLVVGVLAAVLAGRRDLAAEAEADAEPEDFPTLEQNADFDETRMPTPRQYSAGYQSVGRDEPR